MAINFSCMTWNLENLFPVGHPSGPKTQDIYERKMRNMAQTVLAAAPDVLAVQEVGNPACFADLQRRLNDRYPYTMLSTKPDARGIRVGFLSRLPLVQAREFTTFPQEAMLDVKSSSQMSITSMGRGALRATIVVAPKVLINLLNVHLKSKLVTYQDGRRYPLDENERARETANALIKRAAEACAVRVYLNSLMSGNREPLILMGDFNDEQYAVTTQIMLGPEDRSLSTRDKFDDIRLYALDDYISPERRYSRIYEKRREMIDHICVSHELIFHRRTVDSFVEPIDNIDSDTEVRRESAYPDHAAQLARFDLPLPEEQNRPTVVNG